MIKVSPGSKAQLAPVLLVGHICIIFYLLLVNAIAHSSQSHSQQEETRDHGRHSQWLSHQSREGIRICDLMKRISVGCHVLVDYENLHKQSWHDSQCTAPF